ncbi:MAG: D-ribose pyranase [Micrococcaceae bacterium]|nr:D-ribose pyranase [Micrococcaceae bacterium]
MLKTPILNAPLLGALATLGHTDTVVIADAGLPIPAGPTLIDLSLSRGLPSFKDVLLLLADNLVIERSTLALESREGPIGELCAGAGLEAGFVSHEALKAMLPQAKVVVRTGEVTPYANVVLHCGVDF